MHRSLSKVVELPTIYFLAVFFAGAFLAAAFAAGFFVSGLALVSAAATARFSALGAGSLAGWAGAAMGRCPSAASRFTRRLLRRAALR